MKNKTSNNVVVLSVGLLSSALVLFACGAVEPEGADKGVVAQPTLQQVESELPALNPPQLALRLNHEMPRTEIANLLELQALAQTLEFPSVAVAADAQKHFTDDVLLVRDARRGSLMAIHQSGQIPTATRQEFKENESRITQEYDRLLNRLGVPADQRVDFGKPTPIMGQGLEMIQGRMRPVGEPVIHSVSMISRRVFDGIPVEGSHVKVMYSPDGKIQALNLRWPRFELHPEVASADVKSRHIIVNEIASRVRANGKDRPAETKMGLVYRPVLQADTVVYLPSVRVTVTPDDATAGEVFYTDVHRNKIEFAELKSELVPQDIKSLTR